MNNEVKHTPTPWYYRDTYKDKLERSRFDNGAFQIFSSDCEHHAVADCSSNHSCRDMHECEANAAHIVKCVNLHDELVEALKECAEAFNLHAEQYPHMVKGYTLDAFNAAYETLKKAGAL